MGHNKRLGDHIVTKVKKQTKRIDWVMVFIFILWLASVDFNNMAWHSWLAGGLAVGYLIFYAVRRVGNR
ncbi:hypothetical protein M7775_08650 [Sporomusa sphaeroides DSM 2875]|uniref:hypothetical protein n=1 Tax=Sporomusa sphaeroides TaxID=47679 RepID=UPI00202E389D|nr:hypothetical protein [Sporomusa sphaeroides]MCM0758636.1 hypothetical protein [Sporomusa sphaeroides DSM 2875]